MKDFKKYISMFILAMAFSGFAGPVLDLAGVATTQSIMAQSTGNNADVEQAGDRIKTSVIQVIKIIYDKLRYPVSLLLMVGAIGYAAIYRKQGLGVVAGIAGFTFLWAFAPVIVKFLVGLAGGGGPIDVGP